MYEITIKKTETTRKVVGKEWKVVGQEEKKGEFSGKIEKNDKWGYTPEVEKLVESTILVLTQNVENLNVAAVIKAINGL